MAFPDRIDAGDLTMVIREWELTGMLIAPLSESVWIVTTPDVKEIVLYEETICGWTQTGDVQGALTRDLAPQLEELPSVLP